MAWRDGTWTDLSPRFALDFETMPTAHLIHGYLGAGKTTFARRLEGEMTAVRFTHDEWMERLHGEDPPAERFAEYAERVSSLMEEVWRRCLAAGVDVILDSGFWSRAERDRTRMTVAQLGADVRLYRLACPDDEAWQRIDARNATSGRSLYIAPDTFTALMVRFEPLDDDETRIEVS